MAGPDRNTLNHGAGAKTSGLWTIYSVYLRAAFREGILALFTRTHREVDVIMQHEHFLSTVSPFRHVNLQ